MALNPRYLSHVSDQIEDLWSEFETDILCELARRIKHNDYSVSATTKWKWVKLQEMGYTNEYINNRLAFYLKKTDRQIKEIFDNAIGTALTSNKEIFREAYEKGLLVTSGYDVRKYDPVISLGARQTLNEIKNWTKSYHAEVNKNFQLALDKAYLNVNSGLMTSGQASKLAIEELAHDGIITSKTKGGRVEHADVIVKRAVRSGVNQTTSKVMDGVLDDLDCDLVETSSHLGARPSHSLWQGQVFSRSGKSKKYPDFKKSTGYGTGEGLCGWNCRHMFYPFFEGLSSVSAKRYSMQENERVYNLEQKQRYNERMIRKYKRESAVLKAGDLDYAKQKNIATAWSKRNEALIKENSDVLKRNYSNELLAKNYKPIVKSKSKIVSIKDEFIKNSTPRIGKVTFDNDFDLVKNTHEIEVVEWMFSIFGGNIHHKVESKIQGVKTPDIDWNNEPWEIKRPTTLNAVDDRLRKAIKQIDGSYGGVILDLNVEDEIEKIKEKVESRLRFYNAFNLTVILKKGSIVQDVLKMKKHP